MNKTQSVLDKYFSDPPMFGIYEAIDAHARHGISNEQFYKAVLDITKKLERNHDDAVEALVMSNERERKKYYSSIVSWVSVGVGVALALALLRLT